MGWPKLLPHKSIHLFEKIGNRSVSEKDSGCMDTDSSYSTDKLKPVRIVNPLHLKTSRETLIFNN